MTSEIVDKPKLKPEDNPWYLLATLYGEPKADDGELHAQNRGAWNRYMSPWLEDDDRAKLIEDRRHPADELRFSSEVEIDALGRAFLERHQQAASKASSALPDLKDGLIDFSNIEFDRYLQVGGYCFPKPVSFQDATFSEIANFQSATFCEPADFQSATFLCDAHFASVNFLSRADFARATINGAHFKDAAFSSAQFDGTIISRYAYFRCASFSMMANFRGAMLPLAFFEGAKLWNANFEHSTFSRARFDGAIFSGDAQFEHATFQDEAVFVNAQIEGPTSFEGATFRSEPPRFFGAKLHEGTVWRQVSWPPPPNDVTAAGQFVDAYERLKLEMDRLKKHEDELDFFAREMQSRRVLSGAFFGLHIAIYGGLCDYGRSFVRPLVWIFLTVAVGVVLCLPHFGLSKYPQAIGLSLANTFGVFGFRKDFIDPNIVASLPRALKVISAVQTLFGVVLLFLFGLAVRNRFRMK
jgi:uncharacterized protein YjbI with pentapeptide repeats